MSGLQFSQQGGQVGGNQVGQARIAPGGCHQFGLQTSLPLRQVHPGSECPWRDIHAAACQHGGKRGRAALVHRLGIEWRAVEFDRRVANIVGTMGRQHGVHAGTATQGQCQHEEGQRETVAHASAAIILKLREDVGDSDQFQDDQHNEDNTDDGQQGITTGWQAVKLRLQLGYL